VAKASTRKSAAGMASTSTKGTAVLRDEEVADLLQSEFKESLSDSNLDTETELEGCALLDTVIIEGSDEDDSARQNFCLGEYGKLQRMKGKFHRQCWTSRCCKNCYRNCGHFLIVFQQRTN
jgi:hypothetical protein